MKKIIILSSTIAFIIITAIFVNALSSENSVIGILKPVSNKDKINVKVTEKIYDKEEQGKYSINATAPIVDSLGNDEITKKFNSDIQEMFKNYINETIDASKSNTNTNLNLYYKILSNSNGYFSILIEGTIYTGGMHPNKIYKTYNFDLQKGVALSLPSIFKNEDSFKGKLESIMLKIANEKQIFLYNDPIITDDKVKDFYIKDGNLCIFYRQYEIAPYSEGNIEFMLPLIEIKDILLDRIIKDNWGQ